MTVRLEQGIKAVRRLASEHQDMAGDVLLAIAHQSDQRLALTAEQVAEVELAIAEADAGQYASDDDMMRVWHRVS